MRRFHRSRWIPVALVAVLLCVSLPSVAPVRADAPCGTWTTTHDDRLTIEPFTGFAGSGCEVAFQIADHSGSIAITIPFTNISFTSQIAGYTLEMNVTGSDNAAVTKLGGNAIPGIDDELHLSPKDSGANAKVTLDGSVTAKSLSVDMLLLMMNTIVDEMHLPLKCIPYAYVYGLVVDYIPTVLKAAGYMLQFPPQLGNATMELNRIIDDVMKGMIQKIVDTIANAGIGCLPEAAIGIAKAVGLHLLTGGSDFVLVVAHAVSTVLLTGGFIVKDWVAHNRQHAMITLDYSPATQAPAQANRRTPVAPGNVQVALIGKDGAGNYQYTVMWTNRADNAQGFHVEFIDHNGEKYDLPVGTTSVTITRPVGSTRLVPYLYAFNDFGQSDWTEQNYDVDPSTGTLSKKGGPLPAPSNVQVAPAGVDSNGNNLWVITWTSNSDSSTEFHINASFGKQFGKVGGVLNNGTTYTDSRPPGTTDLCYYVGAGLLGGVYGIEPAGPACISGGGFGASPSSTTISPPSSSISAPTTAISAPITVTPQPGQSRQTVPGALPSPSNVQLTFKGNDPSGSPMFTIQWTAGSNDITYYQIHHFDVQAGSIKTPTGTGELSDKLPGTTTSFSFTEPPGTTHSCYYINAVKIFGGGQYLNNSVSDNVCYPG